jgi:hypothetical protein
MTDKIIELADIDAYSAWEPDKIVQEFNDVRLKILSYALLSANTHNIQPWKLELIENNKVLLYIDPERLLPDTDPDYRHIYISQGTFLETLQIAASKYNIKTTIDLFPLGVDELQNTGSKPIAEITFEESSTETDELFKQITTRHTSHSIFYGNPLSDIEKEDIIQCHSKERFQVKILDDIPTMIEINRLLVEAMTIQTQIEKTHLETIGMMRYGKMSAKIMRDGFTFEDLGVTGIRLHVLDNVANEQFLKSNFFKKNIVRGTKKMAESARAYGVIYSPIDERVDQVIAGQILTRIYLTIQNHGISLQPMDHVLQKYEELAPIEKEMCDVLSFKGMTPQCFFRLGRTALNGSHHTPRRNLTDLITKQEK